MSKASQLQNRLASVRGLKPQWAVKVMRDKDSHNQQQLLCADPRATRAMIALMDADALVGGAASHFGGPSAFAELMSATHALMFEDAEMKNQEWFERFHFVNDAGHCENGLYALKANYGYAELAVEDLRGFRSIESKLTGHGEAHLFPKGVLVSNGPLGSSLPQAQGLAMADAYRGDFERITVCAISDGAAMEGEAREAFAAIPGLARRKNLAPFVMLISDNATKLSGRIAEDSFSMTPTFESLTALGWDVIDLKDGHDLKECVRVLESAFQKSRRDPSQPIAVWAKTIKGKGVQSAESSKTGAHGFPLKTAGDLKSFLTEIYAPEPVPSVWLNWATQVQERESQMKERQKQAVKPQWADASVVSEKIQVGVAKAMIEARRRGLPVVSVTSDLQGSTGTAEFHKQFPEACFDVGVAEANMISAAAGFSQLGMIPFVDTFAQFAVTKGALPITMANLSLAPVIGVFSHTGFQDAADGASHQALSYYAQLASIPHVEIYSLSSSAEAEALIGQAIERFQSIRESGKVPPSQIFFLGRENFPRCQAMAYAAKAVDYRLGRWPLVLETGSSAQTELLTAVIVASGSLVSEACEAARTLEKKGVSVSVVHASSVNQPDLELLIPLLKRSQGRLVVVEDHRKTGGTASLLVQALVERSGTDRDQGDFNLKAKLLGIENHFGQSAYQAIDLYRDRGLDREAIVKAVQSL